MRERQQKSKLVHFGILVNRSSANYSPDIVKKVVESVTASRAQYTLLEAESAMEHYELAQIAAGTVRDQRSSFFKKRMRGKVTGLIAVGGDGTFNLTARAALAASIPIGHVPTGRDNNIARSVYKDLEVDKIISRIVQKKYIQINVGRVGDQLFFGSIALGLIPQLSQYLRKVKPPRIAYRWASLASQAVEEKEPRKMIIKIDTFRFEIRSRIFNINLLPYSVGLPVSPASIFDDDQAEVIFDAEANGKEIVSYVKEMYKERYHYGAKVRLFRGTVTTLQPAKGRTMYLDGELIKLPVNTVEISITPEKLKVFC